MGKFWKERYGGTLGDSLGCRRRTLWVGVLWRHHGWTPSKVGVQGGGGADTVWRNIDGDDIGGGPAGGRGDTLLAVSRVGTLWE